MNLFALDVDPARAAQALCDQHVIKQALETAQILSTVAHAVGVGAPYRPTHARHPVVVWAGRTAGNYRWAHRHGLALCDEYAARYGGKTHGSRRVLEALADVAAHLPQEPCEAFCQCVPDQFRGSDAVEAYRRAYAAKLAAWNREATWREPAARPEWLA